MLPNSPFKIKKNYSVLLLSNLKKNQLVEVCSYCRCITVGLILSFQISEKNKSCTVPGGLAAVRKQFEKGQMTSSKITFARSQHQHKSAQVTMAFLVLKEICPAKELVGKIHFIEEFSL